MKLKKGIFFKHSYLRAYMENPLQDVATRVCVWQTAEQYFRVDWVKPKRISQNCHTKSSEAEASCGCVFTAQHLLRRSRGLRDITSRSFHQEEKKEWTSLNICGEKSRWGIQLSRQSPSGCLMQPSSRCCIGHYIMWLKWTSFKPREVLNFTDALVEF